MKSTYVVGYQEYIKAPHQGREVIAIGALENGVFFTVFLVKISINFSSSYKYSIFSITVYISTVQKFQNLSTRTIF
jgi:hypothetical protein